MRKLRLTREKRFLACTAVYYMIIDGNVIKSIQIKNGYDSVHNLDNKEHSIQILAKFDEGDAYSNVCTIYEGSKNYHITIRTKMGFSIGKVFIDCTSY